MVNNDLKATKRISASLKNTPNVVFESLENKMIEARMDFENKSDVIKTALEIALSKPEEFYAYVLSYKKGNELFCPKKDGFNNTKFINTFISYNEELKVSLLLCYDNLRIYINKGKYVAKHENGKVIFEKIIKTEKSINLVSVIEFNYNSIKNVKFINLSNGKTSEYNYLKYDFLSQDEAMLINLSEVETLYDE